MNLCGLDEKLHTTKSCMWVTFIHGVITVHVREMVGCKTIHNFSIPPFHKHCESFKKKTCSVLQVIKYWRFAVAVVRISIDVVILVTLIIIIFLLSQDPRNVRMYQFLPWSAKTETPTSIENTLTLLDHAQRWQLRSEHGPLCFLCK